MPYKIVQTIERGKSVLVAVPEQWEQDGVLYWPRKNIEKLQRNEHIEPEENWSIKNCILKRNNIVSLLKANSMIDAMCELSDTETEIDIGRRRTHKSKSNTQINFNDMAEECSKNCNKNIINTDGIIEQPTTYEYFDTQQSLDVTQEPIPNVLNLPVSEEPQTPILLQQIEDLRVTNYVLPKIGEVSEDLKRVATTLNTISENQQVLFQTQNNILSKLSEMQTQFEEIIKHIFKPVEKTQSSDLKPISNLQDFKEFENSLNNTEVICELMKKLLPLCKKGKGYNNAYILIDVLFERNFLTDCSWAGGSKSDKIKICFKGFTNTIKFFFNVLHESDADFTLVDCHKFLKIILRNSLQRSNNKQLRLSSKKNRQKKTKKTPQPEPIESCKIQTQQESMNVLEDLPDEEA